jgi:Mg2+ and Co2+ transporter CorA
LKDRKFPSHLSNFFDEVRPGIVPSKFPPDEKEAGDVTNNMVLNELKDLDDFDVLEERVSSIVITGSVDADCFTMSIFSLLFQEDLMRRHANEVKDIIFQFQHQQQSGRCLSFLIMLGHLCENLAREYEAILEKFDIIAELSVRPSFHCKFSANLVQRDILSKGIRWEKSEKAVSKLRLMLWSLEALRILGKSVSSALVQIKEAEERMVNKFSRGPGERETDLEREFELVMESYKKRFGQFSSIHTTIDQKSEQITRLRDGKSAISNLEEAIEAVTQSTITVNQGNNIRILTYITIAYLPLGFVVALFALNDNIIPNNGSKTTFIVLMVVFFVATISLATTLKQVEELLRKAFERNGKKSSEAVHKNLKSKLNANVGIQKTPNFRSLFPKKEVPSAEDPEKLRIG